MQVAAVAGRPEHGPEPIKEMVPSAQASANDKREKKHAQVFGTSTRVLSPPTPSTQGQSKVKRLAVTVVRVTRRDGPRRDPVRLRSLWMRTRRGLSMLAALSMAARWTKLAWTRRALCLAPMKSRQILVRSCVVIPSGTLSLDSRDQIGKR